MASNKPQEYRAKDTNAIMLSLGIKEFWRVRIVLANNSLYFASYTEPELALLNNALTGIRMNLIEGTPFGTTFGYLKVETIDSVSWDHVVLMDQFAIHPSP